MPYDNIHRMIHLLYVPTMQCNMQCRYCYLEDQTVDSGCTYTAIGTLEFAVNKFMEAGILPFNISLHGGEVTTLSSDDFRVLVRYIKNYYDEHIEHIRKFVSKLGVPHIKTNMFCFDQHKKTFVDYDVSISGSIDLPLSLHEKYRRTKGDQSSLPQIIENLRYLATYPRNKKISATIFYEHYLHIDEIISDIWYIHNEIGFDMNNFNFMFGFETVNNGLIRKQSGDDSLRPLTPDEQVAFFDRMHKEFDGTALDKGVNGAWFEEFTPMYCTGCTNCGEKFFLLERNGDIFSCVRGQGSSDFYYGNIYVDSVDSILARAYNQIFKIHNSRGLDDSCRECAYLYICNTGCPFVKQSHNINKSYTCELQKRMYATYPEKYPPADSTDSELKHYVSIAHPQLIHPEVNDFVERSNDFEIPTLVELIDKDKRLQAIYRDDAFIISFGGYEYKMSSQLLKEKNHSVLFYEKGQTEVILYIKDDYMSTFTSDAVNNSLYIMLLSGNMVVYGDEQRPKQEHIATHMVYYNTLSHLLSDKKGYFRIDLTWLFEMYSYAFSEENTNNFFVTTAALRDYHYRKQANNGYYHSRAMNLPFQNIEFYYSEEVENDD